MHRQGAELAKTLAKTVGLWSRVMAKKMTRAYIVRRPSAVKGTLNTRELLSFE